MKWARALRKPAYFLLAPATALLFLFSYEYLANAMEKSQHLSIENSISDLLNHPDLKPFAVHILPRPEDAGSGLRLRDVAQLMPWHSHIRPAELVDALNRLIDDARKGEEVFYPISGKGSPGGQTGLFFSGASKMLLSRSSALAEVSAMLVQCTRDSRLPNL